MITNYKVMTASLPLQPDMLLNWMGGQLLCLEFPGGLLFYLSGKSHGTEQTLQPEAVNPVPKVSCVLLLPNLSIPP
jgi:hypothetical protein